MRREQEQRRAECRQGPVRDAQLDPGVGAGESCHPRQHQGDDQGAVRGQAEDGLPGRADQEAELGIEVEGRAAEAVVAALEPTHGEMMAEEKFLRVQALHVDREVGVVPAVGAADRHAAQHEHGGRQQHEHDRRDQGSCLVSAAPGPRGDRVARGFLTGYRCHARLCPMIVHRPLSPSSLVLRTIPDGRVTTRQVPRSIPYARPLFPCSRCA